MTVQLYFSASDGHVADSAIGSSGEAVLAADKEASSCQFRREFVKLMTLFLILPLFGVSLLAGCADRNNSPSIRLDETASGEIISGTNVLIDDPLSRSIVGFYNATAGSVCTASIISENILLTAAHCLNGEPSDFVVIFATNLENRNAEVRKIVNFVAGPLWEKRNSQVRDTGDIALVRFGGVLPRGYEPTPLLRDPKALQDGKTVSIAGYGLNDARRRTGTGQLRKADVTIKSTRWAKTEIVLDQTKGKGACHGDSGGPSYLIQDGHTVLWGVTSRGVNDPRDTCGVYAAYTNILPYLKWIQSASRQLLSSVRADEVAAPTAPRFF